MFRRTSTLLVASTLLGGCYSGFDTPEETAGMTGPTTAMTQNPGETGEPGESSGGPITSGSETGEPTASATNDVTTQVPTTDVTGDDSTGSVDSTTGGEETTLPDPSTTMPDPSTTMPDPTGMPPDADVPDSAYCLPVAGVDPAWKQLEEDVLVIVNEKRAQGADCGGEGMFGPAPPLTMEPHLRCAARKHSADMEARDFFDHTNPDGQSPWDRMDMAGYGAYSNAGENIAAGSPDAAGTMQQWMDSDGHCSNIMNPDFQHIGVGYHPGGQYGHLWTQVFGAK